MAEARRKERAAFDDYELRRSEYLRSIRKRLSKAERRSRRARFIRARALWRKRRKEWRAAQRRARSSYVRWGPAKVTREFAWVLDSARRRGWQGSLNGPRAGARTYAMQAALYALYRAGRGAPAFPPNGPSRHLRGNLTQGRGWMQAVDVSDPQGLLRHAPVVLRVPFPYEPWHVEAAGHFRVP